MSSDKTIEELADAYIEEQYGDYGNDEPLFPLSELKREIACAFEVAAEEVYAQAEREKFPQYGDDYLSFISNQAFQNGKQEGRDEREREWAEARQLKLGDYNIDSFTQESVRGMIAEAIKIGKNLKERELTLEASKNPEYTIGMLQGREDMKRELLGDGTLLMKIHRKEWEQAPDKLALIKSCLELPNVPVRMGEDWNDDDYIKIIGLAEKKEYPPQKTELECLLNEVFE